MKSFRVEKSALYFYNKMIDNQTKQMYNISIELGRNG